MPNSLAMLNSPIKSRNLLRAAGRICSVCLVVVSLASLALAQSESAFERPQAQVIKDQAQQILSRSEYRPRRTALEWLSDMLHSWAPKMRIRSRWVSVLFWIIMVWCVLTLVAILAHFLWTAALFVGAKQKAGLPSLEGLSADYHFDKSHEELLQLASQCALQQQYREAIGFQTLAAIKWLDTLKILSFHASKTNGDYLREYRPEAPGQADFRDMLRLSELALYAGTFCNDQTYQAMNQLIGRMHTHGDQDLQI